MPLTEQDKADIQILAGALLSLSQRFDNVTQYDFAQITEKYFKTKNHLLITAYRLERLVTTDEQRINELTEQINKLNKIIGNVRA